MVGEEARFLLTDRMEMSEHVHQYLELQTNLSDDYAKFYNHILHSVLIVLDSRPLPVRRGPAGRHEPVGDGEVGQRLQLGRLEGGRGLVHLVYIVQMVHSFIIID